MIPQKLRSIAGLSISLAKANFKLRNEGSYLGIVWYLLSPLLLFFILNGIFSQNIGASINKYPLYVLLGLIVFNLFSSSTLRATNVIKENAGLIKSTKINYIPLVAASVIQFLISHIFEMIIFSGFILYYGGSLENLIIYPIILVLYFFFILGVSLILATIGAYVNDLENVWQIINTILWFATPIFYKIEETNANLFASIAKLNPISQFVNVSREVIINSTIPNTSEIMIIVSITLVSLMVGIIIFSLSKSKFAEMV